jgi:hypothetical protein
MPNFLPILAHEQPIDRYAWANWAVDEFIMRSLLSYESPSFVRLRSVDVGIAETSSDLNGSAVAAAIGITAPAAVSAASKVAAAVSAASKMTGVSAMSTTTRMGVGNAGKNGSARSQGHDGRAHDEHIFHAVFHLIFSKRTKYIPAMAEMLIRSKKYSAQKSTSPARPCKK